jgi:hypothetical protein
VNNDSPAHRLVNIANIEERLRSLEHAFLVKSWPQQAPDHTDLMPVLVAIEMKLDALIAYLKGRK